MSGSECRGSGLGAVVTDRWSIRNAAVMGEEEFRLWQALLEERTGMTLAAERKPFLETSLSIRMRELDIAQYADYYQQLFSGTTESKTMEWSVLVDRLTVQETSFFRHPSSYELVEQYVREFFQYSDRKSLDVWSVGCSTGEEPYSLAMLISEILSSIDSDAYFGVTATDISLPTLAKARKGVYSVRKVERIRDDLREKYFFPISARECRVVASLRERICFTRINVLDLQKAPMRDMHLIFCQNMLIYFRRWRKREIVNRLAERLAPGGLMVLGPGEMTDWTHPKLSRVRFADTLAFRRTEQ